MSESDALATIIANLAAQWRENADGNARYQRETAYSDHDRALSAERENVWTICACALTDALHTSALAASLVSVKDEKHDDLARRDTSESLDPRSTHPPNGDK
jgi:hypothetical protein